MLKKTQSKFPKLLQGWLGHKKIEHEERAQSETFGKAKQLRNTTK